MSYRATSPRRDVRETNTFQSTKETDMAPVDTPMHPDNNNTHNPSGSSFRASAVVSQGGPHPRGPAYAQSIYERRMDRSRSPLVMNPNNGNGMVAYDDAGATPSRQNINSNNNANTNTFNNFNTVAASGTYNHYTPTRTAPHNYSTAGTTGGNYTPNQTIASDRQQFSRPSPSTYGTAPIYNNNNGAVVRGNTYNSPAAAAASSSAAVPYTAASAGSTTGANPFLSDLSLTAPDRAMLEMLLAESQDRHFVEKLFVAQEEKHERNQWISIEAHRRRMLQMSYAAPVRIARMEVSQEHRVGDLIAEYEVGEEIMAQRKKMDDRVSELRSMIETTNRYRDALEELENDHKAKHDREMADLEDERRAKKRLLDELTRQYEFASIHNRSDDLYSGAFGLRAGLEFQRTHRREPDFLKSPNVSGPRAVETVTEQASTTGFAIRNTPALSPSARELGPNRYSSATLLMTMGTNGNATTNYSTMTNFNARGGSASPDNTNNNRAPSAAPAAPLYEPSAAGANATANGASNAAHAAAAPPRSYSTASDVILQSQRALARAEELERSADSRPNPNLRY